MEYLSTSALAKELDLKPSDLFDKLNTLGWMNKKNEKWTLTDGGKQQGGQTRTNSKFGEYVVWPENIRLDKNTKAKDKFKFVNSTTIGKHFSISSQRLNLILSELGYIEKDVSGWQVTKLGRTLGGRQFEHETSGVTYVLWPESILMNKNLINAFNDNISNAELPRSYFVESENISDLGNRLISTNLRDKFPPTLKTKDGHIVRSKGEVIIDNALYEYRLAHAYERKLPIEEDLYSDFYLPSENVYIEFWGMENDPKYDLRKKRKLEIYKKYDFKLIELTNADISNLDDHLPRKLLKFAIKVY